jgi:hypothetical protein
MEHKKSLDPIDSKRRRGQGKLTRAAKQERTRIRATQKIQKVALEAVQKLQQVEDQRNTLLSALAATVAQLAGLDGVIEIPYAAIAKHQKLTFQIIDQGLPTARVRMSIPPEPADGEADPG